MQSRTGNKHGITALYPRLSRDDDMQGDRVTYEVIDNVVNDRIEAFETFEEAQEYAESQIVWNWAMADCLPSEVQDEHRKAVRSLLIWFISNTRWIAAHEGEQGIERFVKEIKAELKSA